MDNIFANQPLHAGEPTVIKSPEWDAIEKLGEMILKYEEILLRAENPHYCISLKDKVEK